MSVKSFTRSFAGGEVSPLLYGRLDLAKFQTGLAKCLNFRVTPQGPIENRPGFTYVNKAKYSDKKAVLIPFSYNSEQTFELEFGDQYIRFHTNGGTLLETGKSLIGITQAAPGVFTSMDHAFANGDWLYLSGIVGMTELNARWGIVANATTHTFTLTDLFGNAIDTSVMTAYTSGGTASRVYEIASPYLEADLFDLHYVQSADVVTITHQGYAQRELRRLGATNWALTTVSFTAAISTPAAPNCVATTPTAGAGAETYVTTAIAAETLEESLASNPTTVNIDLNGAGNYVSIQPGGPSGASDVSGAIRYNVYKSQGGVYGYIGQAGMGGAILTDDNINPDMSKTPPQSGNPFTGASTYPRAVSYMEQRRCFGGSTNLPQSIWMTRTGTESNMNYSIPSQDDDRIALRIVAREAHVVRHLVPLDDLLALTSGGVWRFRADGALTASTVNLKPQSYVGASNVQPASTNQSVMYVADRGQHVQEISFKTDGRVSYYDVADISVLAPHLFDYRSIVQLAYATAPVHTLWAVRDDGILLGLTHMPEHEVQAWHRHDTQGLFESVCAVAEGSEDGVYVIVKRTINGQTVRYIERMHTRQFEEVTDAFFMDAGVTYDGPPTLVITNAWHLEGMEAAILADGGVEPAQTVVNGTITLQAEASKVHIGLAYTADGQGLPLASEAMAAFGQGTVKNVNQVGLRVLKSSGIKVGPSFDSLTEYRQRSSEPYGSPPELVSEMISLRIEPKWQQDGAVCIRQADPLPLTIVSMTVEVETGG